MPADPDIPAFRAGLRAFIAVRGIALAHEGVRAPGDAEHERRIRAWLKHLYAAGYLGGGWPVEWGGSTDHVAMRDLVLMEELIRSGTYRPLDQHCVVPIVAVFLCSVRAAKWCSRKVGEPISKGPT